MNHKLLVQLTVCLSSIACLAIAASVRAQDSAAPEPPPDTAGAASKPDDGLNLDMKLEDLAKQDVVVPGLSTPVSTVERQESTIGRSPNAVFVITNDMIKRSGARSIPEALRMAPGVEVAHINAHTWAVTARGYNSSFANKLLIQIDGRVIYNATFGGVYWDQQDVVLADVDRIEVVRGPGTTMWGSNAVNGVINIITKNSNDTQGALIQSGGGNLERDFNTVRYGGRLGDDVTYRIFGQQFDRASFWSETDVDDAWRNKHGGFRLDYTPTKDDHLMLQGDLYHGRAGTQNNNVATPTFPFVTSFNDQVHFEGGDVLLQYNHQIDEDASWQVLAYYDHYERNQILYKETRDQYNIDLQYQFSPAPNHNVITGVNYRNSPDQFRNSFSIGFTPNNFTTEWASVFAQDTMTLEEDRWYFTLGCRLEHNNIGGFQPEPTARLLFLPSERQSMWAAISQAARFPMRSDAQLNLVLPTIPGVPFYVDFQGNPRLEPERLLAYEIGYRAAPTDNFTWDIAAYINEYRKLSAFVDTQTVVPYPPGFAALVATENKAHAFTGGIELSSTYQVNEQWQLYCACTMFEADVAHDIWLDPNSQVYLRSSWNLFENWQYDLIGRYVDAIQATPTDYNVPAYIEMDMRLSWRATKTIELTVVGQNLLQSHHAEFVDPFYAPTEVPRSWYGMLTWTY
jgi:iron complex outermembrane receptor protein